MDADTLFTQGVATAVYKAPATYLTDQVSVTVDNQTVTTSIQVSNLIAVSQSYVVAENGVLQEDGANGLLLNDSAADGETLQVLNPGTHQTQHGTIQVEADGAFTYRPATAFTGTDSFTYQIAEQNNPGVNTTAVAEFQVKANPPIVQGEITGLTPPALVKAPPAVPGNSSYELKVDLGPLIPALIKTDQWLVYDQTGMKIADPSIAQPQTASGSLVSDPFNPGQLDAPGRLSSIMFLPRSTCVSSIPPCSGPRMRRPYSRLTSSRSPSRLPRMPSRLGSQLKRV